MKATYSSGRTITALSLGMAVILVADVAPADIARTKHNLSASGPGAIRATDEQRICKFCHTSHTGRKQTPLWNRRDSGRVYIKYWSPTLDAYGPGGAPPVRGSSRLCLSCHDGTIALGEILQGGRISMRPGAERITESSGSGHGLVGGDLSGSHPIAFRITPDLIARNNAKDMRLKSLAVMHADSDVKLDREDRIQCTTCHDPHDDKHHASSGVPFYRKATWDGVCIVCHEQ